MNNLMKVDFCKSVPISIPLISWFARNVSNYRLNINIGEEFTKFQNYIDNKVHFLKCQNDDCSIKHYNLDASIMSIYN